MKKIGKQTISFDSPPTITECNSIVGPKEAQGPTNNIDCIFAGDLLNQCISSSFGLRDSNIPFIGMFGACSTFVESMCMGAIAIESFAQNVICATSSHFCSAEKQFRFPL